MFSSVLVVSPSSACSLVLVQVANVVSTSATMNKSRKSSTKNTRSTSRRTSPRVATPTTAMACMAIFSATRTGTISQMTSVATRTSLSRSLSSSSSSLSLAWYSPSPLSSLLASISFSAGSLFVATRKALTSVSLAASQLI